MPPDRLDLQVLLGLRESQEQLPQRALLDQLDSQALQEQVRPEPRVIPEPLGAPEQALPEPLVVPEQGLLGLRGRRERKEIQERRERKEIQEQRERKEILEQEVRKATLEKKVTLAIQEHQERQI